MKRRCNMKAVAFNSIIISVLFLLASGEIVFAQDLQSAIRLTRSERFSRAESAYKALLKKNPGDGSVCFYYGENFLQKYFSDTLTYFYKEIADSASRLFQMGIDNEPANPLNYVGLGEIELIKKNKAEAQSYFDKAIALLPSKANKTSTIPKKEQAVVMIKMANSYLKAYVNDSSKVFPLLRSAEQLDNKNFDLFIVKGDAYMQLLNDGSTAIANYNQAQNLNPQSPRAKLRLGQLWMKAGNYTSALSYYSDAVKIDSTYAPAHREMGYLFSKTNQDERAKESFGKFLLLSAGNRLARMQYINILLDLQDYHEAIKEIEIVTEKDSSNNDFNRALGYSCYETSQYAKGLYYMTRFFEKAQPGKIRTLDFVYYGRLLAKNNRDSLAGEVLMKAFQMDTTQTELLNQAISEYIKMKNYSKAAEIVIQKTLMKKDVASDYFILGKLYYNLHEWHKADSAFGLNISLDPHNIKGYLWKAWSLVNQDPDSKEGLAKPTFEALIEKARSDSTKNMNDLKEAYSYLSYYYFLQFIKTKNQNDGHSSKEFCEKVIAIEPANEKAKTILKELNLRLKQ
jgi:predicted Zn-dependent protease